MVKTFIISLTSLFFLWPHSFEIFNIFNITSASCQHHKACIHALDDELQASGYALGASYEIPASANFDKYIQLIGTAINSGALNKVMIDPGHGGRDHGCSGKNSREKDIVLKVSLQLGKLIKTYYPEVQVLYTRKNDTFIPLHKRASMANKQKADLFISIHCNSINNAAYIKGSETYVLGLHRAADNLAVAKRENAAMLLESDYQQQYQGYDPNSTEGHIMLTMFQHVHLEKSIRFAELVEQQIASHAKRKSRGVKQAGFWVLRETTMPSVLVETGYLTNTSDNQYLSTAAGQKRMAESIYNAFNAYKMETDASSRPVNKSIPYAVREAPVNVLAKNKPQVVKKSAPSSKGVNPADYVTAQPTTVKSGYGNSQSIVRYKVQLLSSPKLINIRSAEWAKLNYSIEVKKENGLYKYLAFGFRDKSQANRAKQEIRNKGFKDAFIVAYRNGQRVDLSTASR